MGIRKRGETFQVYVYNPIEKRQISETCYTRRQAEKRELELKAELSANNKNKGKRNRKNACLIKEYNYEGKDILLSNALLLYLKNSELSKGVLVRRVTIFKALFKGYAEYPLNRVVSSIKHILLDYFANHSIKNITKKNYIIYIKAFFKWCISMEYIKNMPEFPIINNTQPKHFIPPTQEEISALLSVSPPHYQRIIIIGSQLGVRVGDCELLRIQWKDVDWTRHVLRLKAADKNKNEPFREIPLSDTMYRIFQSWYKEDNSNPETYLINFKGKPMKLVYHMTWKELIRRAGIRYFRPYDLRHAFATEAIAAGADIGTVAKLMGHTDSSMVLKYYQHVMDKQKVAVMENMPSQFLARGFLDIVP